MNYFYCLKPDDMIGSKLVPLSKLKDISISKYKGNKEKYDDRKELNNKDIKILDCQWDDVVFFSTIDPSIIFMALEFLKLFDAREIQILKFPIDALNNKEFCLYTEDDSGKESFTKIKTSKYKELNTLPSSTAKYFIDCVSSKEDPLIFSGIPQILLKGELSIKLGEEFTYTPLLS